MTKVHSPPGRLVLLALIAIVAPLFIAPSADAAETLQTITANGSQQSGRWRVFNLNAQVRQADAIEVTLDWDTSADVNVFMRDANGNAIEYRNGSAKPKVVDYAGNRTPTSLAVLVSSGQTSYRVTITGTDDTPPPPPPPPVSSARGDYPGQPAPGTVYWGASIQGNGDPVARHERHVNGAKLGLRRTFFRWDQRTSSLVSHARDDVRAGRVPWVSVTTPGWQRMANGSLDGQIDQMLRALDGLNGPVWLTIHHEPEGGGGSNSSDDPAGPSGHLAMNRQVRERMTALGVDNVALAPILMAWTWDSRSGRNVNAYWDDDVYDFVGVDMYAQSNTSLTRPLWYDVRRWAANRGVDIAIGEWGIPSDNATAAGHMRDWYWESVGSANDGRGARVTGLAVFDSDHSTSGRYRALRNSTLTTFRNLMTADPSTWIGE